jgi:alpha-D-xyloside xylohydrolase
MLGENILVAPVFSDSEVQYYLPAGLWTNYLTGEQVTGPLWRTEEHSMLSMPIWVRPGAVLATGNRVDRPDYDYLDGLTITVYPGGVGTTTTTVTSSDTGATLTVTVQRGPDSVTITTEDGSDVQVRLAGGDSVSTTNGKAVLSND